MQLLNTLYVTTEGAYLKRDGETVVVKDGDDVRIRIPIHNLESIVCFGRVSMSPWFVGLCGDNGVSVTFLSVYGRFLGRLVGRVSGNVLLRRDQYRQADDPDRCRRLVAAFVAAKIANSRAVVLRAARDTHQQEKTARLHEASDKMKRILRRVRDGGSVDVLRGFEGEAARHYFGVFPDMISERSGFTFAGRSRRPPLDEFNAVLSFLYVVLGNAVQSALETVGLDPAVGFLHGLRPGRPSLALDLMEEFRSIMADRLALALVNRGQIKVGGFSKDDAGGFLMDDATRKSVLEAVEERKRTEVVHPFLGEKMNFGLIPHMQARLLSRFIRGDLEEYPPFFWK